MKKRLSALAFIWLLLWSCLAFADSHQVKPTIWACDPGTVAYNCARMGLPMPVLAMPMWEGAGNKVYDYSGGNNHGMLDSVLNWKDGGIYFSGSVNNKIAITSGSLSYPHNTYSVFVVASVGSLAADVKLVVARGNSWNKTNWICKITSAGVVELTHVDTGSNVDTITGVTDIQGTGDKCITYQYDGVNQSIWLSGISEKIPEPGGTPYNETDQTLWFGCDPNDFSGDTTGYLKIVIIFSCSLTATQINVLHNNSCGMFEPIKWPIWDYSGAPAGVMAPYYYMNN